MHVCPLIAAAAAFGSRLGHVRSQGAVAQEVERVVHQPEGRWFDPSASRLSLVKLPIAKNINNDDITHVASSAVHIGYFCSSDRYRCVKKLPTSADTEVITDIVHPYH